MTTCTRLLLTLLVASLASCASTEAVAPEDPLHFEAVAADTQTVATGDISNPLTVRVLDPNEAPVTGIEVKWSVTGGHGAVTPSTDTTGVNGTSSATYQSTGEPGVDTVVARLGQTESVRFLLRVTQPAAPGTGHLYFRIAGNAQTVAVNDTSIILVLEAQDSQHVRLPGLPVTWVLATGSGTVISGGDTTDLFGRARAAYIATADTGTRIVTAHIGPTDSLRFSLRVAPPCPVGTLAVGQVIEAVFAGGACPHEEVMIPLVKGEAYFISETHHPDPTHGNVDFVDPLMTFWHAQDDRPVRSDRSRFLSWSDDENGGLNSALFFVAPTSGEYRLVAGSFANVGFGGYHLSLESCPVIVATADTGTQSYTLPPVPPEACRRQTLAGKVGYRFLSVPVAAAEQISITVTSTDFTPVWESFSNWDAYESGQGPAIGNGVTRLVSADETGLATIAIAGSAEDAAGEFTVTLTRGVSSARP